VCGYGCVVAVVEEDAPKLELPNDELPKLLPELPKLELPTGLLVLLAGVPMFPVFPLIVFISLSGS